LSIVFNNMKKIFLLIIVFGGGIYLLFLKKEKAPEIVVIEEEKPKPSKGIKILAPPPKYLDEPELPLKKPYLGPDFNPIDPPSGNIQIQNEINPNLEKAIQEKLLNPAIPSMAVDIKRQGTFILVKSGVGLFVEQVLVSISSEGESARTFNAYADAQTGEIIHTIEPQGSSYSSDEIETSDQESFSRGDTMDENSVENIPEEEMTIPVEE
jgi:hypothetical protein